MLPKLRTARLLLHPATSRYIGPLQEIWDETEVRRYLFEDAPITVSDACGLVMSCLDMAAARGLGLWVVRRKSGAVIGSVGLLPADTGAKYDPRLEGAIEPVAAFAPSVWHHGYATEALEAVLEYGFKTLGLRTMAAVLDEPNEASARLVRRLGFVPSGESDGPRYRLRSYLLTVDAFMAFREDTAGCDARIN